MRPTDDVEVPAAAWNRAEELRIHRRMFDPQHPAPGEAPVPTEYWLESISISLTQMTAFSERPDLYRSPGYPAGVDAERWRAIEAMYDAEIFFKTQGPNDFSVHGKAHFVVLDRRLRLPGVPGKYTLYRWEDLGSPPRATAGGRGRAVEPPTWSRVKSLYR
jgi:hypothetical protein